MKYKYVLFDLDGTLMDTSAGVLYCVEYALSALKKPRLPQEVLRKFIGPSLYESFEKICGFQTDEVERAVQAFRAQYAEKGQFMAEVYPGMKQLLQFLSSQGLILGVTTLKHQPYAEKMLSHFGLSGYFTCICGSSSDKSVQLKKDVISRAISLLGNPQKEECVLIGDSIYDALGAQDTGVDFIGVSYGFGYGEKYEQLLLNKPHAHCPEEIKNLIFLA